MTGTVLYRCTSCSAYLDVKPESHLDPDTYIECDCGEKCEPVSAPADVICDLSNFITKVAYPALSLALSDYAHSVGPRTDMTELDALRDKHQF